ncbi:MAG: SpaA isopeptide-forming pilin-related protein [Bifidobacterium sp.]|uniref:SpaA isopeptide-forming pilin-related protein n=1 Tax=Bifidobacterium sp. TaxID=41200 RepID=UPI00284C49FD|nr:SpaA isopeptide-forming pilin-related protein [Bifidobacterium sp.]MDR4002456.1 SpaA isopeptide-forming pilin-related protein [Bifidobacterium sp.]
MTQRTIRRRCAAFLAIGAMAALAMPSTAQAAPQLADLDAKQSMSVKASNGERLEGKNLHAIQLATYTAASVDDNTIVGYDLTTNTALASDITAAAKTAGATDANLTVNGKNDPMVWVVKNLTDSRSDPWSGKLRNFCNSLAKQTNFAKQEGTAVATLSQDKTTMSTGNVLVPGIYAIVDRTPATTTPSGGTAVKTTASIMMMNGTAVIGSPCNVNSIDLEYSHNPNAWQDHNNQPGNEVKVCTGEIALRKVDTKNQKLTGAKFTIAQGTSDKTPLKLVSLGNGNYRLATSGDTTTTTTFEAGETKIQGLKGEYTITETQAPQDYSSLMLPSAVVTVNIDDATMTWSIDVKSDPNNLIKKDDSHTVVVTNIRTITEIPLTGAAGLTMLFSIAALLFIGGIVMLRMCKSADDC